MRKLARPIEDINTYQHSRLNKVQTTARFLSQPATNPMAPVSGKSTFFIFIAPSHTRNMQSLWKAWILRNTGNTLSNPTASPGVYLPLPSSLQLLATQTFTTSTNSYNPHSTSHRIEPTHCVPGMCPDTPRLFPKSTPPTRRDPPKYSSWGQPHVTVPNEDFNLEQLLQDAIDCQESSESDDENSKDYRNDSTAQQRESNDKHWPSGSCKPSQAPQQYKGSVVCTIQGTRSYPSPQEMPGTT